MAQLIPGLKEYVRPQSVDEALGFLSRGDVETRLYAGATSLAFSRPAVERVIDLTRLPLSAIEITQDSLEIGALTSIRDLERHPLIQSFCGGILRQACDRLASTPLRNLITAGGNLLGGFPWSDLPAAFLTLDAELRVVSAEGNSVRPMAPKGIVKRHDMIQTSEILTGIRLPTDRAGRRGAFIKLAKTTVDFGIVVGAVSFGIDSGGRILDPRVACGSVTAEAMRIRQAEELLSGQDPSDELFELAGRAAATAITPRADTRAPEDYRREMLGVTVTRALVAAWKGGRA